MRAVLGLALASFASASLHPRNVMHLAQSRPLHPRAISNSSEPCQQLSKAFAAANSSDDGPIFLDVPPSVGLACLKSVPVDKERDIELIEYLTPLIAFQSTIEILMDPPEEYLLPGVDILGGLDNIYQKLEKDEYESQYEVMSELRSIFVAANDGHFNYPPAILSTMFFARTGINFASISKDGLELPKIYLKVAGGLVGEDPEKVRYESSPVESVDGVPVIEFLENDASQNVPNSQDPDAQFNSLFTSVPGDALGMTGTVVYSASFEIPDNYTIKFENGTERVVHNRIIFPPGVDFSDINSGEEFHEAFELVPTAEPTGTSTTRENQPTSIAPTPTSTAVPGYPDPYVKDRSGALAGYLLNGTEYDDVMVLAILSFLPIGGSSDPSNAAEVNFIENGRKLIKKMVDGAKKEKRNKLIIDLSANGGGSIMLAHEIYRLLFPKGNFTTFDRMRANEALGAASAASYKTMFETILGDDDPPVNSDDQEIKTGKEFFGPYNVVGQNVTTAFFSDITKPIDDDREYYYNGQDPNDPPTIRDAPFLPENILIVTDGVCASSCDLVTGLFTRTQGVRTLALGGRPLNLPMQAMGGTKGTQVNAFSDFIAAFNQINLTLSKHQEAAEILEASAASLPSLNVPPLLPLMDGEGSGSVNSHSGYSYDDLEGYPLQFRYEAAHCRLFYTEDMITDVTETWRRAADIAWNNGACVNGSSANEDNTMANATLPYNANVRSRAAAIQGPGSLDEINSTDSSGNSSSANAGDNGQDSDENSASHQSILTLTTVFGLLFAVMMSSF